MKILVEDTIPFGDDYFSALGDVERYAWQSLQPADLRDCDYLVVRSTTAVTPELLSQASSLKLVTTATAGTNHMDTEYLDEVGIPWNSAAGCNAIAVAEYVVSALLQAAQNNKLAWPNFTVGIVGAGNVGTALSHLLDVLGVEYRLCDPPKQAAGDLRSFVTLNEALQCDVISLHVPFTRDVPHATDKMLNHQQLSRLLPHQIIINACRGEVIDESALQRCCQEQDMPTLILDVFANEPDIDTRTLAYAWLATPHIAGHSVEGKVRGTQLVYEQVCRVMGKTPTLTLDHFLEAVQPVACNLSSPHAPTLNVSDLTRVWCTAYDIRDDDRHFRQGMAESNQFASLRKHYRVRRECSAYTLLFPHELSAGIRRQLTGLGFSSNANRPM